MAKVELRRLLIILLIFNMLKYYLLLYFVICLQTFNFLVAQDCNPQVHIDHYKTRAYEHKGQVVIKTFPIDFQQGRLKKLTYKFNVAGAARCHFIYSNKKYGNRGIIVKIRNIRENGIKIPVAIVDARDFYAGPIFWEVLEKSNYEVEFSFNPKYIAKHCGGAVLFMYMK